jgi:hypothetical protein
MAVTSHASDAAPAALTLDTPSTLSTITAAGVYCLWLDLNNLAAGDILVVRVYTKVVTGGTSRLVKAVTVSGTLTAVTGAEKAVHTIPYTCVDELKFEIEQTDGTGRVVPFNVHKLS